MAGDKKGEMRKVTAQEGGELKGLMNPQISQFQGLFNQAAPRQMQDYGNLMSGYEDFQKTGGYSSQDLSNIRSRSVSPVRAAYANANRNVNRQKSLQGGYSPGMGTLQARMAREQGQAMSDASTNTEANIAQMVQQGKLAGLQGGSNLYGTTPGMSSTYGNQVLNAIGQRANLGMGLIGAERDAQQLGGRWDGIMGGFGTVGKIGSAIGRMFGKVPWGGGGASSDLPSSRVPGSSDINSGLYDYPQPVHEVPQDTNPNHRNPFLRNTFLRSY